MLRDDVFNSILAKCTASTYEAVVASPPCSTFSVSRHCSSASSPDGGPPVLRTRDHPSGLPAVPSAHRPKLDPANKIICHTCLILRTVQASGGSYILEHPADRGCLSSPHYLHAHHAPLWLYPRVADIAKAHSAVSITFSSMRAGRPSSEVLTLPYYALVSSPRRSHT
eukprot:5487597-Pleurochrysis_carterae.AAC.1